MDKRAANRGKQLGTSEPKFTKSSTLTLCQHGFSELQPSAVLISAVTERSAAAGARWAGASSGEDTSAQGAPGKSKNASCRLSCQLVGSSVKSRPEFMRGACW